MLSSLQLLQFDANNSSLRRGEPPSLITDGFHSKSVSSSGGDHLNPPRSVGLLNQRAGLGTPVQCDEAGACASSVALFKIHSIYTFYLLPCIVKIFSIMGID